MTLVFDVGERVASFVFGDFFDDRTSITNMSRELAAFMRAFARSEPWSEFLQALHHVFFQRVSRYYSLDLAQAHPENEGTKTHTHTGAHDVIDVLCRTLGNRNNTLYTLFTRERVLNFCSVRGVVQNKHERMFTLAGLSPKNRKALYLVSLYYGFSVVTTKRHFRTESYKKGNDYALQKAYEDGTFYSSRAHCKLIKYHDLVARHIHNPAHLELVEQGETLGECVVRVKPDHCYSDFYGRGRSSSKNDVALIQCFCRRLNECARERSSVS